MRGSPTPLMASDLEGVWADRVIMDFVDFPDISNLLEGCRYPQAFQIDLKHSTIELSRRVHA